MKPIFILTLTIAAAAIGGCDKPEAGVRVDLLGSPSPISVEADAGSCTKVQQSGKEGLAIVECSVPPGRRRFSARCGTATPAAVVVDDIPEGTSNYVQFNDVCSSSPEQITRGNASQRLPRTVWKPGS